MILVTGATGFIGRHVVAELARRGRPVRALVRDARGSRAFEGLEVDLAVGDVADADSLAEAAQGTDGVVHLVAIITGRPKDFERVIATGTANVVAAAQSAGVRRFVHMSALGVGEETKDTVPYYRTKWEAEQTVTASGLSHVVLRPSFVFGRDDGALPRFVRIARLAPVTPIVGPGTQKLQPIWIDDLARAIAVAVEATAGPELIELGGPDVVDWNGLWAELKSALGTRRPSLHLPTWLMRAPALVLERLPNPPVTRDQLTMLQLGDNVVTDGGASMATLGVGELVPLAEQLQRAVARD